MLNRKRSEPRIAGGEGPRTAAALFLSPQSVSLDWSRYAEPLRSGTVIHWWLRRIRSCRFANPYVLVHTDQQRRALEALALGPIGVIRVSSSSATRALAEFARQEDIDHVALVTLATALGPIEILNDMFARHLATGSTMTWASGLPQGVGAWVFARGLLEELGELKLSGLPSHPGLACRKLRAAAASGTLRRMPVSLSETVVDVTSKYSVRPGELPIAVSINTAEEVEIAREVLTEHDDPRGLEALLGWKRAEVQRNEARLAEKLNGGRPGAFERGRAPRILYVSNASAFSGAEESLCQLVRKIDKRRFETCAAVGVPGRFQRELERAGARVVAFADGFFEPTIKNFMEVRAFLDEFKPDLIHSNALDGLPFLWNAVERRIPFVQHVRNGEMTGYRDYVESASAIVAVSNYLRDGVLRFAVNSKRVHVIYDEVDTEWFHPGAFDKREARKKYGIPLGAKVIVMIARFAENKRHDLMLQAFDLVRERVPGAHLILKGEVYREDRYYDGIRRQIDTLNHDGSITQIPFVEDIREVHAMADSLALCSDREGLGRCVVEAMSMGVPAVVTDTGGSHEIIEDGVTGAVVPGGNPEALAARLAEFLEDEQLNLRAGLAARRFAEQNLTAEASASRAMALYDRALG